MLDRIVRFGDALVAPMWGGEEAERVTLMMTLVGASCISFAMLMIWRHVLAPAIPAYATRTASDRVFLGNSFVSMWPAVTAPVLAIRSMAQLPWSDLDLLMVAPADEHALRAVGISCGYMLYDTIYCSVHREMRSPLIIGHHVLPVLFWPYCCLNHRALPIVLFFILTEITNIGQHLRMMLLKFGLEGRKVYTVIGVSWVIMFFAVRIAPSVRTTLLATRAPAAKPGARALSLIRFPLTLPRNHPAARSHTCSITSSTATIRRTRVGNSGVCSS